MKNTIHLDHVRSHNSNRKTYNSETAAIIFVAFGNIDEENECAVDGGERERQEKELENYYFIVMISLFRVFELVNLKKNMQ